MIFEISVVVFECVFQLFVVFEIAPSCKVFCFDLLDCFCVCCWIL